MKVVILCGGAGTRMKEETEFKPKPLVLVGGQPLIWHIMKIYAHYGFNEFILALGYKGEMIKQYFLNWKSLLSDFTLNTADNQIIFHNNACDDFKITFAETGLESLTGERVRRIKKYLNGDDFMITYGDGVSDINIRELLRFHKEKNTIGTITGVRPATRFGFLRVNPVTQKAEKFYQHAVTNFDDSEKPVSDYINGGFMVFKKEALELIEADSMIEALFPKLSEKKELSVYVHPGKWKCMDTYKEVEELNKLWAENPFWKVWDKKPAKNILVTGGAGFIGSQLVDDLIAQGHNVFVLDNLSSGRAENINPKAKFYKADVRDKSIFEILNNEKIEGVYHLAAQPIVAKAYEDPLLAIETNVMGTTNLLEACRQKGDLAFIVVFSSDKAYGRSDQLPYKEDTPLKGSHPYDASKSVADLITQAFFSTYGLPVAIARFSNIYGPRDFNFSRIIPGALQAAIKSQELLIRSDGKMIREYTYVKDAVLGCQLLAANIGEIAGQAFNFGSADIFSVTEVIKKIEEVLGQKINSRILNISKNEIPEQYLDWTKAKEKLGWRPQTDFNEGLAQAYGWYKDYFKN